MRIITWDLEINEPVEAHPDRWEAARRGDCGLASLALADNHTGRVHLYDRRTLGACIEHLSSANLLVGFNSINFDAPCLIGVAEKDGIDMRGKIELVPHYDICQEIWNAIGKRHKGWGLGPTCERTLGIGKSGTGEHAPVLAQQGRWAELHDYNINDVHLTQQLFNHIVLEGYVIGPDGETVHLLAPEGAGPA